MDFLNQLQEFYQQYDEKAAKVKRETKGLGGIWGMGEDPRNHPCHVEFYEGVQQMVTDFLAAGPESRDVAAAAKFILEAADLRRETQSYWFCFAAQGHVIPMIPHMNGADCKELVQWYDGIYTKLERMPVQRDMYKKLRKASRK